MMSTRPSQSRGFANHGWLQSAHSFSFASYYDPRYMGLGNLRVINEDRILRGSGFGTHPHKNMEIITYVLSGALAHKDSMGNGTEILPGDVQRMSAGKGVTHSEFNAAPNTTHFLQIWITPNRSDGEPSYQQRHFSLEEKRGQLRLIASPTGHSGSLSMNADAEIYAGHFDDAEFATLDLDPLRPVYVHLIRGSLHVNGETLESGDALTLSQESQLHLKQGKDAEVLVFLLAAT